MTVLRLILGDQLSPSISSLQDCDKDQDIILMAEVWDEATYVRHHKKKIAFLFSAMRHFAADLTAKAFDLCYIRVDEAGNTGSLAGEVQRLVKEQQDIQRIVVTAPGEYRVLQDMKALSEQTGLPVEIRPDDRFICDLDGFSQWANSRKQLRMEHFYRLMRRKTGLLMEADGSPAGGEWNYDTENRKPPKDMPPPPRPARFAPDAITEDVLSLVADRFGDHFGNLQSFDFAVTRDQALRALDIFIADRLPYFGTWQDAMLQQEPFMYHAHIGQYLNAGLLLPLECAAAAEKAYQKGHAPLNAVEGFIRQVIGWREYVRGIYWHFMPDYAVENFLEATRPLPSFFWTGMTEMNCLRQSVMDTKRHAYAHHIQRLMVLGNFALLAGLHPEEVNEWYLIVYADAYEWVEMPNVSGMVLFADAGKMASKPYAASGAYINRMSDYCGNCRYRVTKKNGPDACPFNYLYWDFMARNRGKLAGNQRLSMVWRSYDKMDDAKKAAIAEDSRRFLGGLD